MYSSLSREFEVGEKRLIEWEAVPNSSIDTVVVTNAEYSIIRKGEVIKSGSASIDGTKISCIFEAEETGSFILRISVTVPPETIISDMHIDVVR